MLVITILEGAPQLPSTETPMLQLLYARDIAESSHPQPQETDPYHRPIMQMKKQCLRGLITSLKSHSLLVGD